jgi:hypothetical protein
MCHLVAPRDSAQRSLDIGTLARDDSACEEGMAGGIHRVLTEDSQRLHFLLTQS